MIEYAKAKEVYGFRDADNREDTLTIAFLNTVRPVTQGRLQRIVEFFSPIMIIAVALFVAMYAYNNNAGTVFKIIPIVILLVFVPSITDTINRFINSSGIVHESKKLGTHFLLAYGVLQEKTDKSNALRVRQSAKVKLVNGQVLENVLLIREFYDKAKEGQRIVVALADSPKATQLIGILPEIYNSKEEKKTVKNDGMVKKPDSKKQRAITQEERIACESYYTANRKAMFKIQNKNRMLYLMLPAIVIPIISLLTDKVIFIHFAIVLGVSFIFMNLAEILEIRSTSKELLTKEDLLIMDAEVSAKPTIVSGEKRFKTTSHYIEFKDNTGNLIHRSKKREDYEPLNIGDQVYVVYRGEKTPLICKK